jgi:hypothetical protein
MAASGSEEETDASVLRSISGETTRLCAERYRQTLEAVILTGSLARGEATLVGQAGRTVLLGDAEFLLFFAPHALLPAMQELEALCRQAEGALLAQGVVAHISLSAGHPDYLRALPPHIFAYELRTCGQVVWGDSNLLSLISLFPPTEIPFEDAWRLLSNRMVELLEPGAEPAAGMYRTIKLYLDMATSFLVFVGEYAPTYRERADRLRSFMDRGNPGFTSPIRPREFVSRVDLCTRLKLEPSALRAHPDLVSGPTAARFASEAVTHARLLWRWELDRLTGAGAELSDDELLDAWMRMQPLAERLRGWLYVLRRQAWRPGWRKSMRWAKHGWRASPRYWIYAASSELLFQPRGLDGLAAPAERTTSSPARWRTVLPVVDRGKSHDLHSSGGLAADILSDYREFVVDTRA